MGHLNGQFRCLELHQSLMIDGISRGVPFSEKDLQVLSSRTKSEGSSFLYVTLPSLGRAVDGGLSSGTFDCPRAFSRQKGTCLPKLMGPVFRQVFDSEGRLLENASDISIFFLRQVLLINSKLIKQPSKLEEERAVDGFESRQTSLRKFRIPLDHPVLNLAQALLGQTLRRLSLRSITPGHGPGVVHERKDRDEKWDFRYWPSQANRVYPFYEYGVQSLEHLRTRSDRTLFLREFNTKICLVPKDFRGPRLISAEMSAMQYLQQGQMREMMAFMESHPLLRLSVSLRDQTKNQLAAMEAVENCHFTLDLSDASDLLSAPLVWFLLAKVPDVRRCLFATRSRYATFGGRRIRIAAFAPMGSATCFPVETLVFWAITMASAHLHLYGSRFIARRDLSEVASNVKVFGDDIIAPDYCRETLVSTLLTIGCRPNMHKTCWRTPFRESCGTEWFRGSSVSITRNRSYTYANNSQVSHHPLLVDLQRRLCVGGLRRSAELVANWTQQCHPTCVGHYKSFNPGPSSWSWATFVLSLLDNNERNIPSSLLGTREERREFRSIHRALSCVPYCLLSETPVCLPALRLRYNAACQTIEFRVPVQYQKNRPWMSEGYERLLARLLGDSTDRVANRDISVKLAWRQLPPGSWSFMTRTKK